MDKMQWAQTEAQELPSEYPETLFTTVKAEHSKEVAQRGHGVSLLRYIQTPSRHGCEQLALGGPA